MLYFFFVFVFALSLFLACQPSSSSSGSDANVNANANAGLGYEILLLATIICLRIGVALSSLEIVAAQHKHGDLSLSSFRSKDITKGTSREKTRQVETCRVKCARVTEESEIGGN